MMFTVLSVPAALLLKAPVALATVRASLPTLPVKAAPPVFSVAAVLPSYTLSLAVMPVIALMLAGLIVAARPVVSASV